MSELSKEVSQKIAALITPLINFTDMILDARDIEQIEKLQKAMANNTSTLAALPFPATLNKAEERAYMDSVFRAIIDLLKARKKQRDNAGKKTYTDGKEILQMMGY